MLRWLGWGALAMLLLASCAFFWLVRSESGLRFALEQGLAAAGGRIEVEALRGSLAGGFELDAARIELPGVRIAASRLALRLKAARLLAGELHVEALRLAGARYTLLPSDAAAEPVGRPGALVLPVDLVLRNLDLVDNALDYGGADPLRFSLAASEIALREGRLEVGSLALRHGELRLRARAAVDTAQAWRGQFATQGEWAMPQALHRGELKIAGNLDALAIELALEGGGELRLQANLRKPIEGAGFDGRLGASAVDLASFGIEAPVGKVDLDLGFAWIEGRLSIDGPLTLDGRKLDLKLDDLALSDRQIRFRTFELGSQEVGRLALAGHWPSTADGPAGAIDARLDGAWAGNWLGELPADAPRVDAALELIGHTAAWQAKLDGNWRRGEHRGPLQLALAGTPERIEVAPSRIGLNGSALALAGWIDVGADQRLAADLRLTDVDPALFAPDWPGRLGGDLRVDATLADGAWALTVHRLDGELRGAPLALAGRLVGRDAQPREGQLELRWGEGRLELGVPEADALSLLLKDFDLALAGPWKGRVEGRVDTRLNADPVLATTAVLRIADLAVEGVATPELRIGKRAGWQFDIASEDLEVHGLRVQPLRLALSGDAQAHRLELEARESRGRVRLALAGTFSEQRWSGTLEDLELQPAQGASWSLADTAALAADAEKQSLGEACLHAAAARACIAAARDSGLMRARIALDALPLKELQAWAEPVGFDLDGRLSGGGELTLNAEGTPGGALEFRIEGGQFRGGGELDQPLAFNGTLGFDGASAQLSAALDLPGHGRIDARAEGFDRADGSLHAKLALTDLSFVDGLTAEVQGMRGGLAGEIVAPLADPTRVRGKLESSALAFELPAAGLKAHDGRLAVLFEGDGLVRLDGALGIDPGTLRFEGLVGLGDSEVSEIRIRGDNAGLVDLPAVRLAGDTNFLVKRGLDGFSIEGGILLRSGKIDLDRFQPAFPPSEDVIIEDAPPPPPPLPISAEVSIALIQAVDLRGYGIEATLNGGVRVSQKPGKLPQANGEMLIRGIYNAYGQKLDIERGRLGFGGGRADNPSLDILAAKRVDRQRIGVQVRGTAKRPAIRLYSDPLLDQSETLSYLVLGRPLATASGADSEQLGEYASALETAGGSLVAGSIGKKLGLAAGVESFGAAIGSALVVGKYLSPRFFIGYGQSLLDAGQLVILRYRLTENIELEGISGAEQKASASWRTER